MAAVFSSLRHDARAQTANEQKVSVTIEEIRVISDLDTLGDEDFVAQVVMNGAAFPMYDAATVHDKVVKPNWQYSRNVPTPGDVHITIKLFESDSGLRGNDDHVDISPVAGYNVDFVVSLPACTLSGEVNRACDTEVVSEGDKVEHRARIKFRVTASDPPATRGGRIRCLHSPLWPAAGVALTASPQERVTIVADGLDEQHASQDADPLEIYVDLTPGDGINPTTPVASGSRVASLSHGFDATATFAYQCRAVFGGQPISTGWRVVQVGQDLTRVAVFGSTLFGGNPGEAHLFQREWVPIMYTGPAVLDETIPAEEPARLDIVFFADVGSYPNQIGGWAHPAASTAFLSDTWNTIYDALFGGARPGEFDYYLANQDKLNFWVAANPAQLDLDIETDDAGRRMAFTCDTHVSGAPFADANLLLYRDLPYRQAERLRNIRDCNGGSATTSPTDVPNAFMTVRHELAHALFGLADEYPGVPQTECIDDNDNHLDPNSRRYTHGDGGYFQNRTYPNLWDDEQECVQALADLGGNLAAGCRSFLEDRSGRSDKRWYTTDPGIDPNDNPNLCEPVHADLMVDDTLPRMADIARMDWVVRMCNSAACGAGVEGSGCLTDLQCRPGRSCRDVIDEQGNKQKVCTRSDRF